VKPPTCPSPIFLKRGKHPFSNYTKKSNCPENVEGKGAIGNVADLLGVGLSEFVMFADFLLDIPSAFEPNRENHVVACLKLHFSLGAANFSFAL
jgi:hypothetical protein